MSEQGGDRNDWIRHSGVEEGQRSLLTRGRSVGSRIVFSILLISAGVFLFLANLGLFQVRDIWLFWPLFPICVGLGKLVGRANASTRVWGIFLVFFGALFLLTNFGWVHIHNRGGSWPLSLLLIAAGLAALVSVLDSSRKTNPLPEGSDRPVAVGDYQNSVTDYAVFGSLKRKLMSNEFQGGDLTTVFGSLEVDLRHAAITSVDKSAVLNINAIFGAVKLRVPALWRVHVTGAGIFGNFEDKTIPPNIGPDAPALIITGLAIFSAVEIED